MAKIDLYDPKWIDMVFADKNKAYGAYQLRKGTAGRNIKALIILLITALLIGGFLAYKVIQQQKDAERQAYMEQMELSKLKEQAKREKKEQPKIEAKVEPKKVVAKHRSIQHLSLRKTNSSTTRISLSRLRTSTRTWLSARKTKRV